MGDIVNPFNIFGKDAPTPQAPNTASTIEQQKQASQLFQITPQGTLEYGTIGPNGEFIPRKNAEGVKITESPFQQQFRTQQEALALELLGQVPSNLSGYRTASDIEGNLTIPFTTDFSSDANRLEQETFQAGKKRLDPIIEQERRDLIQNLADRGIPLSSEAGQKELNRFDQSVGDRQSNLAYGAIEAGRVEQNRLASLSAALRGQQVNEQLAFANLEQQQRAQQFGEVGALGGFAAPFQPFNAPTVDVASIINQGYANQLGQANFQQGIKNQNMQFIGDLASAGATAYATYALSDARLKENIHYQGTFNNYKLYDFNYIGDSVTYRGVMAQDILKTNPEAVSVMDNGYYGVHYDKLGLKMEVVHAG